jgi:uncharacterized protein YbjT (DUF2867 family)
MFLVTGATRNVGGELVRALAEAGQQVRALTRGGDQPAFPPGTQAVAGDLDDPASLRPALDGAEGVFLLPGYADMAGCWPRPAGPGSAGRCSCRGCPLAAAT